MLRKIKPIDPKEFSDVQDIQKITIKGEMRKVYDEINRKLAIGWSAKDVVELLAQLGLSMPVELFRVYLRDLDIERGYKRSTRSSHTATTVASSESTKEFVPAPNSLSQTDPAYSRVKAVAALANEKNGNKTLSSDEIKELSKKEIDLTDYQ